MQDKIYSKWVEYIGQSSTFVYDQIGIWLNKGMSPEVLLDIISTTAMAPAPSWRYAAAICRRAEAQKLFTVEAWEANKAEFAGAKQRQASALEQKYVLNDRGIPISKRVGAQGYTQRRRTEQEWKEIAAKNLLDFGRGAENGL